MSAIPENSAVFSAAEVLAVCGGVLHGSLAYATELRGVSTDTRAALNGKLFVALRGERFDGHAFLADAARAGATAALVEQAPDNPPLPVIQVPSTLAALGQLARAHRSRFRGTVIAVAGSAGKTTTRAAIGALLELSSPGQVHQVAGNLNNLIGVPHVLFGLEHQRYAVIEIGTNAPGEVAELTAMTQPNVAVLTLIGLEHTQGLVDLDGVEREEGALLAALAENDTAVVNADDSRVLRQLERSAAGKKLRYGFGEGADVRALRREVADHGGQRLLVETSAGRLQLEVALLGEAGAYATLAALAVGQALGLSVQADALALALSAAGEPGRLRAVELGDGSVLLDDTYNANPASMLASLAAAAEIARARGARLLLVLGEMRELGESARVEHDRVGQAAARSGGAVGLIAVGGDAELYVEPARAAGLETSFAPDSAAALELALARVARGDVVLVKASRGVHAERVVEGLLSARGRAA